jgi:putative addiction module component (TIGR02574 family)
VGRRQGHGRGRARVVRDGVGIGRAYRRISSMGGAAKAIWTPRVADPARVTGLAQVSRSPRLGRAAQTASPAPLRYTGVMSAAAKQIIEAALKLDPVERVGVAEALWDSIDAEPTEDVERQWNEELARRRQKIETGQARFFSVDEVKADAQKILSGR